MTNRAQLNNGEVQASSQMGNFLTLQWKQGQTNRAWVGGPGYVIAEKTTLPYEWLAYINCTNRNLLLVLLKSIQGSELIARS